MNIFLLILESSEHCCTLRITKNLLSLSILSMYFVSLAVFSLHSQQPVCLSQLTLHNTLHFEISVKINSKKILVKYQCEEAEHQYADDTDLNYLGSLSGSFSDCMQKGRESFREANTPLQTRHGEFWRKRFL